MPKPPRDRTSFGSDTYFLTASTRRGRPLFQTERMARLFIDTLSHYRRQGKFLVHEFVVMPNHLHLCFTPLDIPLERAVQFIKGGFSYRVKKEFGLDLEVWERGYIDHRIRDANDYERHAEYIRANPVRARMVIAAQECPYSSVQWDFDQRPRG
jgi:putative transposase